MPDKGRIILYYVMQVVTGTEDKVEEQVKVMVGKELYDSCFHPMRRMKKKFRGEWREVREKLLPGYVFIVSDHVQELYQELKHMPVFTRMLGKDGEQFVPLSEQEAEWLKRLAAVPLQDSGLSSDRNMEVQLSQVSVSEDDAVTILSGPLKNMEGYIRKIDLHRRIAKVEVDFMNRKTLIHLGIEMVEKRMDSRKC
jgi:transcriptional antiterminator NusG